MDCDCSKGVFIAAGMLYFVQIALFVASLYDRSIKTRQQFVKFIIPFSWVVYPLWIWPLNLLRQLKETWKRLPVGTEDE